MPRTRLRRKKTRMLTEKPRQKWKKAPAGNVNPCRKPTQNPSLLPNHSQRNSLFARYLPSPSSPAGSSARSCRQPQHSDRDRCGNAVPICTKLEIASSQTVLQALADHQRKPAVPHGKPSGPKSGLNAGPV